MLVLFFSCMNSYAQRNEVDSLRLMLEKTNGTEKIAVYQEIITSLWLNHPDSAMYYVQEALVLSHKIKDTRSMAITSRLLGGVYYYKGVYDSAIKYSYESYAFSESIADSMLMTSAMNNIGLAYYNLSSYPEALEFLLRALNLKIKLKQEYGFSTTLNNVGLVYTALKDYDKARQYFEQAKTVAEKKGDKDQQLYSFNNIGFTYLEQRNLTAAENYFLKALDIARSIDNVIWHASSYSGLAQVYLAKGEIKEAKRLFKKSLELGQKINDPSGIAEVYSFYGDIYMKTGKMDSARFFLHQSQRIASSIGAKDQMILNFNLLKDFFIKQNKLDSALIYQSHYIALRDSVMGDNLARSIKDIQLAIERGESQTRLAAKDDQIRKITIQTYFLIGMMAMSVIFLFFLYRAYKEHRRLSDDLAKRNREITLQKEEIHQQRDELALSHDELERAKEVIHDKNIELSKLNAQLQSTVDLRTQQLERANEELKVVNLELDNFIYRSSHDIRGPLLRLLGICHVALIDIDDERAKEYFSRLYEAAQQLNEIFDRLKILSNINDVAIHPVSVRFDELLSEVLGRLKQMDGFTDIEIEKDNQVNEWHTDRFLLDTILFNLLENSIRFQKKSPLERKFVKVKTSRNGKYLKMSIIDNGIGVKEPDMEKLQQMFSRAARAHGNIGLGLYIVKQCINKLNGSIQLVDNHDGHTEFEVTHPILDPQNA